MADPFVDRTKAVYDEEVPDPVDLPTGCFFKDRCPFAVDACDREEMDLRPPAAADGENWDVACHRAEAGDIDWSQLEDHNL